MTPTCSAFHISMISCSFLFTYPASPGYDCLTLKTYHKYSFPWSPSYSHIPPPLGTTVSLWKHITSIRSHDILLIHISRLPWVRLPHSENISQVFIPMISFIFTYPASPGYDCLTLKTYHKCSFPWSPSCLHIPPPLGTTASLWKHITSIRSHDLLHIHISRLPWVRLSHSENISQVFVPMISFIFIYPASPGYDCLTLKTYHKYSFPWSPSYSHIPPPLGTTVSLWKHITSVHSHDLLHIHISRLPWVRLSYSENISQVFIPMISLLFTYPASPGYDCLTLKTYHKYSFPWSPSYSHIPPPLGTTVSLWKHITSVHSQCLSARNAFVYAILKHCTCMLEHTRITSFLVVQIWNHGSPRHAEKCVAWEKMWATVLGYCIHSLTKWKYSRVCKKIHLVDLILQWLKLMLQVLKWKDNVHSLTARRLTSRIWRKCLDT